MNTEIKSIQIDSITYPIVLHLNGSTIDEFYSKANTVIVSDAGGISGIGKSRIGIAQLYSSATFVGKTHIGYLRLQPGTQLTLNSADTLYLYEYFDAIGNSSFPITVNSSINGQQAMIFCASGQICCAYLSLSNTKTTGGAQFYAGPSSTNIFNNTGWNFSNTCDILSINAILPACKGSSVDVTTTHSPFVTGFLWSGPSSYYNNAANITIPVINKTTTGLYTLQAGGQTRKILIQQEVKPDTTISKINDGILNYLYLTASSINSTNGYFINWYKDGVLYNDENISNITPMHSGMFHASYTTPAGCTYTTNSLYYSTDIVIAPLYAPYNLRASIGPNNQIVLAWEDMNTFIDGFELYRSTEEFGAYDLIQSISFDLMYDDYSPLTPGTYYYKVRAKRNPDFSDYSNIANITLDVLGTVSSSTEANILIKPVPVQDYLTVESLHSPLVKVSIYDRIGVEHFTQSLNGENAVQLDLKNLPQGVYIIKINTIEGESNRRFIK